jgi:hypothetical protein
MALENPLEKYKTSHLGEIIEGVGRCVLADTQLRI